MSRHSSSAANPSVDNNTIIVIDGETDEQRLPLKKRHHHMQRDGGGEKPNVDQIEIEIEIGAVSPVKLPPPITEAVVVEKEETNSSSAPSAVSRCIDTGAGSQYRTGAGKPAEILSPSKMLQHRPMEQGIKAFFVLLDPHFECRT
jgi:hypothetical protein